MLHQLKNGNWIELADVRRIRAVTSYPSARGCPDVPDHVMVHLHGLAQAERIDFATIAEAEDYRGELAAVVNAVQSRPKAVPIPTIYTVVIPAEETAKMDPAKSYRFATSAEAGMTAPAPAAPGKAEPADPFAKDWSKPATSIQSMTFTFPKPPAEEVYSAGWVENQTVLGGPETWYRRNGWDCVFGNDGLWRLYRPTDRSGKDGVGPFSSKQEAFAWLHCALERGVETLEEERPKTWRDRAIEAPML